MSVFSILGSQRKRILFREIRTARLIRATQRDSFTSIAFIELKYLVEIEGINSYLDKESFCLCNFTMHVKLVTIEITDMCTLYQRIKFPVNAPNAAHVTDHSVRRVTP